MRFAAQPVDATYDFFVTANHMVDWVWPADSRRRADVRKDEAIPRICEHLANSAKHFRLDRYHDAVTHADCIPAAFNPRAFDCHAFKAGAFRTDELVLDLGPDEAAALGRQRINAVDLARLVLSYWEHNLPSPDEPLPLGRDAQAK